MTVMCGRFVRTVHPFADDVKRDKPPTTAPCNLWGTKAIVIFFFFFYCLYQYLSNLEAWEISCLSQSIDLSSRWRLLSVHVFCCCHLELFHYTFAHTPSAMDILRVDWKPTCSSNESICSESTLRVRSELVALLVARRTNNRKVMGSRPTKVVCITVLTGNHLGWTVRHSFFRAVGSWSLVCQHWWTQIWHG